MRIKSSSATSHSSYMCAFNWLYFSRKSVAYFQARILRAAPLQVGASLFTLFAALKLSHFNHICAYCLTCCCCCCCVCCFCCYCIWLEAGQRRVALLFIPLALSLAYSSVAFSCAYCGVTLTCMLFMAKHTHILLLLIHSTVNPFPTAEQTIF